MSIVKISTRDCNNGTPNKMKIEIVIMQINSMTNIKT